MTLPAWLEAALVGTSLAAAVCAAGAVTASGALAGALLAFAFTYWGGWLPLAAFGLLVVLGTAATRLGYARKQAMGVAQARHGRRSAAHAFANAGPAALLLVVLDGPAAVVASLASLAAALTDTVSSETGMLARETPRLLLVGRRARAGEDGAMTWRGTAAGVALAWLIAFGVERTRVVPGAFFAVAIGAIAGNLADSVFGAAVEARLPRRWHNEIVNALAAAAGGGAGWLVFRGSA
jgi:uncharacterized protein (TIGR00297 family)